MIIIDANILVYATVSNSPFHEIANQKLQVAINEQDKVFVSSQILKEYHKAMTANNYIPFQNTLTNITLFEANFIVLHDSKIVFEKWHELVANYHVKGRNVFDCNIVATMLANEISHILTHNVTDFQRYNSLISVVPMI